MSHLLLRGDARRLPLADGSVDLILCDPPYGTTECEWDSIIPLDVMWENFRRVLKPRGVVVITASQPFTSMLVMSNREWFRYELIWTKDRATGHLDANRKPMKSHESVLVFSPGGATYNAQLQAKPKSNIRPPLRGGTSSCYGRFDPTAVRTVPVDTSYPRSVLAFNCPNGHERGLHPTQKPTALMEYLIRTYSNEGDLVLDPTMGSGTAAVAAYRTGRRFVGVEIKPEYVEVARRRLARAPRPHYGEPIAPAHVPLPGQLSFLDTP